MKLILKLFIFIFLLFWLTYISNVNAEEWDVVVVTSERIPWAECDAITADTSDWTVLTWRYKCTIGKWFSSITMMMWKIVKYFTFIAWLGGVLFIVLNGILYSMSWMEPAMKDDAKKRITGTILGLILLLISWVILKLVAPWVYV